MKSKFPISYHIMESYYDTAEDLCAFYEVFEKYFYTVFVTENIFCVRKLNPRKSDDKKKKERKVQNMGRDRAPSMIWEYTKFFYR
jgi:hypothetical protein